MPRSYLSQIAQPVPTGAAVLKPSHRFPLRAGEERPAALPDAMAAHVAEPVAPDLPRHEAAIAPSLDSAPAVSVARRATPAPREAAAAAPPSPQVASAQPASAMLHPEPTMRAAAPQVLGPIIDVPVVIRPPASPSPTAVTPNPPALRGGPNLPGPAFGDLRKVEAVSQAPSAAPATAVPLEDPAPPASTAIEPRRHLGTQPRSATPRREAGNDERAGERAPDVPPRRDQPAANTHPVLSAVRPAEAPSSSLKIGSIEVRVLPAGLRQPPAPAAAPRAPSPLSRGFASPFGLRQG